MWKRQTWVWIHFLTRIQKHPRTAQMNNLYCSFFSHQVASQWGDDAGTIAGSNYSRCIYIIIYPSDRNVKAAKTAGFSGTGREYGEDLTGVVTWSDAQTGRAAVMAETGENVWWDSEVRGGTWLQAIFNFIANTFQRLYYPFQKKTAKPLQEQTS